MPRRLLPILALLGLAGAAHAAAVDRVIRRFDFEERAQGNMEDIPMDWEKVEGPGLPHYVNGALTTDQAHGGKYSFGFQLNGGNLVYRYPAGKIAVHPGTFYRVAVSAKTQDCVNARAQLTGYFADSDGNPIRSSVVRSKPTTDTAADWTPLGVNLEAPSNATWLVIELGLVQPALWRQTSLGASAVYEQDITGRAWFDDVNITQVPQVHVGVAAPGNVFRRSQPVALDVELNDRLTADLVGRLTIRDADGAVVYQQSGDFGLRQVGPAAVGRVVVPSLPAGWYQATTTFESGATEVGRESVSFVQLADNAPAVEPDVRFGVVATALPFDAWDQLPAVLPLMGVSRVKLSVWNEAGDIEHTHGVDFGGLIDRLADQHITPVACLSAAPPSIARWMNGPDWARLDKVQADTWQAPLSLLMTRYAGHFDRWQFGTDDRAADFAAQPALRKAYNAVLVPMNDLFRPADLAMPWPIYADPPAPAPPALALNVPTDVLPPHLPLYVSQMLEKGTPRVSLALHPLTADSYGRAIQVRDWAQRIGYSLAASANRLDLPLPFDPTPDGGRQPSDLFLVDRTMLTALSGATFKGRMPLGDDVEALLFDHDGEGVLLAWTKSPQAQPKTINVMLGAGARAADLNGNVSAILRPRADDGTTQIVVGPTPSLVIGIDGLLAQLRASFAFDNSLLESSYKPHIRRLTFKNPYPTPITGQLKLAGPAGWTMTMQSPTFSLLAGETYDGVVTIEFPFSSVAGTKPIDLTVKMDNAGTFKVPLTMRLGLGDLGLDSSAFRDGNDVIVQQMITNYGSKPANYTAYATYPGQARQERLVSDLRPGVTVIKRFRFTNVGDAVVKSIRSGVRETEGTRQLVDDVPLQ